MSVLDWSLGEAHKIIAEIRDRLSALEGAAKPEVEKAFTEIRERLSALEAHPVKVDLTSRVEALEQLLSDLKAQLASTPAAPAPSMVSGGTFVVPISNGPVSSASAPDPTQGSHGA